MSLKGFEKLENIKKDMKHLVSGQLTFCTNDVFLQWLLRGHFNFEHSKAFLLTLQFSFPKNNFCSNINITVNRSQKYSI